jgi:hypothetical protein
MLQQLAPRGLPGLAGRPSVQAGGDAALPAGTKAAAALVRPCDDGCVVCALFFFFCLKVVWCVLYRRAPASLQAESDKDATISLSSLPTSTTARGSVCLYACITNNSRPV